MLLTLHAGRRSGGTVFNSVFETHGLVASADFQWLRQVCLSNTSSLAAPHRSCRSTDVWHTDKCASEIHKENTQRISFRSASSHARVWAASMGTFCASFCASGRPKCSWCSCAFAVCDPRGKRHICQSLTAATKQYCSIVNRLRFSTKLAWYQICHGNLGSGSGKVFASPVQLYSRTGSSGPFRC